MKRIYKRVLIVLFCFNGILNAQTINKGTFVVNSGTILSSISNFDNTDTGDFTNDGTFIVYRDFNNDGLVSYTPAISTGLTHFKGAIGAQTISGSVLSEFNNVRFENNHIQPAFLLEGDISVNGISDFTYGIVDNLNYSGGFIFEDKASHKNTSNKSYVAGYVERNQNNPFEFPIGDGGFFRPSSIGQSSLTATIFRSKYLYEDTNALHPHIQKDSNILLVDGAEYWEFMSDKPGIDTALTLSWNEDTTPNELFSNTPGKSLAIVRWNEAESKWKAYSTAVDENNKIATAAIKDNGVFTLARVITETSDNLIVYNAVSPNGDGKNDYFKIDGLSNFPNNKLEIYNRWGVKIFETRGYGINENWFTGYSNGRATVSKNSLVPSGTYFYVLSYEAGNSNWKQKTGYLYVS